MMEIKQRRAGIHHSWGAGTIKWFTCLLEKQLGRVWEKIIFQPVTIVSSVLSYWDQNRIDLLLSAFSAAPNGSFAMLHYAYWCVMNRSEARWLNKHIRSHLMSADSGGAECRSPPCPLTLSPSSHNTASLNPITWLIKSCLSLPLLLFFLVEARRCFFFPSFWCIKSAHFTPLNSEKHKTISSRLIARLRRDSWTFSPIRRSPRCLHALLVFHHHHPCVRQLHLLQIAALSKVMSKHSGCWWMKKKNNKKKTSRMCERWSCFGCGLFDHCLDTFSNIRTFPWFARLLWWLESTWPRRQPMGARD